VNVVLYLRMSTDRQEASIPQQRDAVTKHARKLGYTIVREYADEGISGDCTHKRKAFQKMIADAAGGSFDRILCFDQDRFGRFDMIEAGWWIMPLRDAGVSLETIAQGVIDWSDFAGRLTYAVAQEGKHQFLRDLSRNSLRGQIEKALSGDGTMHGAPATYGYRRDTTEVGTGKNRKRITKLVPVPTEARVVKKIFETYAGSGGTLLAVGEMLNGEGIPSPNRRSKWHRNAVRRILKNRTYVGDYVWGQTMSGRYHVRVGDEMVERRRASKTTSNDPIVHEGVLPAIVSRDLFDRVQELLGQRKKATRRPGSAKPLSGLIFCGCCGSPMHVNFNDYRCSHGVDFGDGERCTTPIARGVPLINSIAEQLQAKILSPTAMAAVKKRLEAKVNVERKADGGESTKAITREIDDLEKKITDGLARIPLLPKGLVAEFAKGLEEMRVQRDTLTRQRDASRKAKTGGRLPIENRIAEALAAAYGLRKTLAEGDATVVNDGLRRLGLRVYFEASRARVVVDPVNPVEPVKLGRKPHGTRNVRAPERDKSHKGAILVFEVPVVLDPPLRKRRRSAG
jgi:DNA invertase Pin-like site-specific DNA recombinase